LRAREADRQTNQTRPRPVARVSQTEYLENLLAIVALARTQGAPAIVIAAPYRDHSAEAPEADSMLEYRAALGATMRRENIPFLELRELTEEAYPSNEGWFGERIHPNHMGHRLLASELLKLLKRNRALGDLNIPEFIP
jgi:lysophospholipase L1-like esterase